MRQHRKGKHNSEEWKRKFSEAMKGRHHSKEHKKKIGEANKGKKLGPHSEKWKNKVSETLKDRMTKVKDAYKQYKLSGGSLKWNDFQKQYKGD